MGAKSLERSPAVGDFYGTGIEFWAGLGPNGRLSCLYSFKIFWPMKPSYTSNEMLYFENAIWQVLASVYIYIFLKWPTLSCFKNCSCLKSSNFGPPSRKELYVATKFSIFLRFLTLVLACFGEKS